jgi:hypothetical protein
MFNNFEVCDICEQDHTTNNFPYLPKLKFMYQGTNEEFEKICFIS